MDRFKILTNNALKIIACISMVFDHIGVIMFPEVMWLRAVGRLAYPLFAFCLAEGCYYTKDKIKHLIVIAMLGVAIQLFEYVFLEMIDLSIFIVFSISIILIYLLDDIDKAIRNKKKLLSFISITVLVALLIGLNILVYYSLIFDANFGYYGIIVPVILYAVKKYLNKHSWWIYVDCILLIGLFVARMIMTNNVYVLFSLFVIPLLLMYNGKRGKWKIKYFFYFFYPLHLAAIYLISMLFR
ncbi:MAG: hypothetical protein J6W25_03625 [Bacilli bacterium]|nr:hypothetical protein [Bacilli bacterium]